MRARLSGFLINIFVLALGLFSLLAPFAFPWARTKDIQSTSYPIMVSLIIVLCLFILFLKAQSSDLNDKMIPFIGVLIAINGSIRFLENAIPGPAGFSPTFFLIILTGYYFGGNIGLLMGAMTMFVSGLITGGVGPWLPGQMITAGWVGQSAGLLKLIIRSLKSKNKGLEIVIIAIFGAIWGLLYGVIMNLWFWPYLSASQGEYFTQQLGWFENFQRYTAYYLTTSLIWDITRSIGNVLIIITMTRSVLKIFKRFSQRFSFQIIRDKSI
jgi:energy-coupling factor transport system substrate-specific component